jgi:hypothetical protein
MLGLAHADVGARNELGVLVFCIRNLWLFWARKTKNEVALWGTFGLLHVAGLAVSSLKRRDCAWTLLRPLGRDSENHDWR